MLRWQSHYSVKMYQVNMLHIFICKTYFNRKSNKRMTPPKQWRRKWQPTPVFFPGKSHGQRSLEGYSPWGHKRVKHNLLTEQQPLPKQTGVPLNPQAHLNLLVKITHSISHHENCTLRSAKNNQTLSRIQEGFSIY